MSRMFRLCTFVPRTFRTPITNFVPLPSKVIFPKILDRVQHWQQCHGHIKHKTMPQAQNSARQTHNSATDTQQYHGPHPETHNRTRDTQQRQGHTICPRINNKATEKWQRQRHKIVQWTHHSVIDTQQCHDARAPGTHTVAVPWTHSMYRGSTTKLQKNDSATNSNSARDIQQCNGLTTVPWTHTSTTDAQQSQGHTTVTQTHCAIDTQQSHRISSVTYTQQCHTHHISIH
jgi:hypothetical protein